MNRTIKMLALSTLAFSMALPAMAADGAATFKAKCAMCHGADGSKSTAKMPALSSADVQKKSDAQLTDVVAKGAPGMPGFAGKLSNDDVKATVSFVRTLKK